MSDQDKLNDYDSEPVRYCAKCYSLKIKYEEAVDIEYCDNCGCSDILESSIEEWEKKYIKKYGHKYIEKSNDIRNSIFFKMPLSKLMQKVSDSPKWNVIIREIYPYFPKGLSKADSVVVFFDLLIKHNALNSLRALLYKMKI